ncbi:MAG: sensor histidine kinase, partial [Chitinophagaceae bacterium]
IQAFIPELKGIKIGMEKRRDLFAIFKEAIHNIVRHSGAKQVVIKVSPGKRMFILEINDDGKGFAKEELAFHNGLKYMQQRAERNNWKLHIISKRWEGTRLILEIKIT